MLESLTYIAKTAPPEQGAWVAWVLLGVVLVAVAFAIRAINRKGLARLQGEKALPEKDEKPRRPIYGAPDELLEEEPEAAPEPARPAGQRTGKPKGGPKGRPRGRGPRAVEVVPEPVKEAPKPLLLLEEGKSLDEGLVKTRNEGFVGRLRSLFQGKQIDAALLDQLEEVLFTADIGVRTSQLLLDGLKAKLDAKELADETRVWEHLRGEATRILGEAGVGSSLELGETETPHVVLVIGVNGSGKTTTIGKLAHRLVAEGRSVTVGAGDTFRAAAVDQLGIWAERVGADLFQGKEGADPSSVLYDAIVSGTESGSDVILCDTAGRLHTHAHLVEELKKVRRVVGKALPGAPHEVLLVLDATTGQNAIAQASIFGKELGVTGIVLTKLDGTAKGGVILGITHELKVPICWVGVGERTQDLRRFDAADFVDALFGAAAGRP